MDSETVHKSKKVDKWLKKDKINKLITCPRSPNTNPVENLNFIFDFKHKPCPNTLDELINVAENEFRFLRSTTEFS